MLGYKQDIIDIVYSKGCVTRAEIIRLFYEKNRDRFESDSRKSLEATVDKYLSRLTKAGVFVKKDTGLYCKP
jgi:hypothetical protein